MNHAKDNHIGKNQNPSPLQTTAAAQTVRRICRLDAKAQGCRRNTQRQAQSRTNSGASDAFLKCLFLPKLKEIKTVHACRNSAKMEKDFYKSLSLLAEHYHIEPIQSRHYGYPYNIALALDDVEAQLRKSAKNWEEIRLVQDSQKTYLTSEERYSTGSTLYYIPILPLYSLSKSPERRNASQLLQSVCSYLYHIADVAYYRQQNSYLYWMYEMVAEWVTSDDENEDTPAYLKEITQAQWIGDYMERKIYSPHNLNRFKNRLDSFKSRDGFDNDCFMLARDAFELFEQFPNETIYRNSQPNGEAEEDEENIVSMQKYVSFCADAKGMLFQSLFESVNTELQEYGQMEEPVIVKHFDGSDITATSLDFENRFFALIEELIYILNNF